MRDQFNRKINYLRVSVTDRCNLRCVYCMPADGVEMIPHDAVLSFEEITDVVSQSVEMGINKIRLTGGEPLVRRGIISLVEMIGAIKGIDDYAMTTNAILLPKFAADLKTAGIHRLNISLDTMDPERFRLITRCGELSDVLAGIDAARAAGFEKIRLNCVVKQSGDEPDAKAVAEFGRKNGFEVRFIQKMDLKEGHFSRVIGGDGGHCEDCNRLRLSSDGHIYPCLFSDRSYCVRELGVKAALRAALENKPESGVTSNNNFFSLGG